MKTYTDETFKGFYSENPFGQASSKPLLGICPEYFWRTDRIIKLCDAIKRYTDGGLLIPMEWNEELGRHVQYVNTYIATIGKKKDS